LNSAAALEAASTAPRFIFVFVLCGGGGYIVIVGERKNASVDDAVQLYAVRSPVHRCVG
jgi:hypothetical protein